MRADAGHSGKLNSIAYEGKEEKKNKIENFNLLARAKLDNSDKIG